MTTIETVQSILKAEFDLAPETLHPGAVLADLEIDSLAVVEVLFEIENRFKVTVPSDPTSLQVQIKTLGDLVAYVDKLVAEQRPGQSPTES